MTSVPNLVKDSQLPVRFSDKYTHHDRHRGEETWERQKLLGQGSFGSVWLQECRSEGTPRLRAVKLIPKVSQHFESIDYNHELLAIAKFSQPKYTESFVRTTGWYEDPDHIFIAMEYFEYGDLEVYLGQPLPEKEAQQITSQLLCGLEHMHSNDFTHRDLKPKNIFVASKGPKWWVKIGDFGVSKRVEGSMILQTCVGTPYYIAPEIRGDVMRFGEADDLGYTSAVDIWSLGVIVCRLLTGKQASLKNKEMLKYIHKPTNPPPGSLFSDTINGSILRLLEGLLAPKPERRLSAGDALQNDWLRVLNESSHPSIGHLNGASDNIDQATLEPSEGLLADEFETRPSVEDLTGIDEPMVPGGRSHPSTGDLNGISSVTHSRTSNRPELFQDSPRGAALGETDRQLKMSTYQPSSGAMRYDTTTAETSLGCRAADANGKDRFTHWRKFERIF
ncbi:hypothetical protein FQN54_009811 [Arachnomyces sp. PD_36]|nr:hypothetical protein FQN54_009811 [Arachnomyces sp. PD_36]